MEREIPSPYSYLTFQYLYIIYKQVAEVHLFIKEENNMNKHGEISGIGYNLEYIIERGKLKRFLYVGKAQHMKSSFDELSDIVAEFEQED